MKIAQYICMAIALSLMVSARVKGVDMSEGQILIAFWLEFLLAFVLLLVTAGLMRFEHYKEHIGRRKKPIDTKEG